LKNKIRRLGWLSAHSSSAGRGGPPARPSHGRHGLLASAEDGRGHPECLRPRTGVAPRCSLGASDRDGLPVGKKEGERLGEVDSPKWGMDGSSGGGSSISAWRTPARRRRVAPGRRGARRWLPIGEALGGAGARMRRMAKASHGWRALMPELCGGVGRLRAPAVGGSNQGEKGMGSGGVWEENGVRVGSGRRVEEKRRGGGGPARVWHRQGHAAGGAERRFAQRGSAGAGAKGGPVRVGHGWAVHEGMSWSERGGSWAVREATVLISIYNKIPTEHNWIWSKNWLSLDQKFSNKIRVCREFNKEQLSPYELLHVQNGFQIKIQGIQCLI
jgi:hypothetical protein